MKKVLIILTLLAISEIATAQVRVRIKADIGTYLSVCTGCQPIVNANTNQFNTATLHAKEDNGWYTHYTMKRLSNGNYVFINERGQYMSLCTGCIIGGTTPDFITFHTTSAEKWTQFKVKKLSNGKYTIRSVHNNKYVARCNGCSPRSGQSNVVTVHSTNAPNEPWAQWEIEIY